MSRSAPLVVVADTPVGGPGWDAERIVARLEAAARHSEVTLLAPEGPEGPLLIPGTRHLRLEMPPGLPAERRSAAVGSRIGEHLDRLEPRVVHVLGVAAAIPALMRGRKGLRVVLEPGIMPSQRLRDLEPRLPASRLEDLVRLEDNTLRRAAAVIARSNVQSAGLVQRGVDPDRVWTLPDGLPRGVRPSQPPDLPHVLFVGDLAPWSGWRLLIEALARLRSPWRLTMVLPRDAPAANVSRHARRHGVEARVSVVRDNGEVPPRAHASQVVVCPMLPTRSAEAGGVVPQGARWALACGRVLAAADLPAIRGYVASAACYFEPANAGALAACLEKLFEHREVRAALIEEGARLREALSWEKTQVPLVDLWTRLLEAE